MLDRDHLDRFDVWEEGGAIVGEAPGGEFASFCGMWYDAVNRVASTEPVAAGPHFRGRGLGTAAVMEGVRICPAVGTRVAYVGADQPFSLAMGFGVCRRHRLWRKVIEPAFGAEPGTQPPLEES
jgi:GNAT superfamily N-acetyltransferase